MEFYVLYVMSKTTVTVDFETVRQAFENNLDIVIGGSSVQLKQSLRSNEWYSDEGTKPVHLKPFELLDTDPQELNTDTGGLEPDMIVDSHVPENTRRDIEIVVE